MADDMEEAVLELVEEEIGTLVQLLQAPERKALVLAVTVDQAVDGKTNVCLAYPDMTALQMHRVIQVMLAAVEELQDELERLEQ